MLIPVSSVVTFVYKDEYIEKKGDKSDDRYGTKIDVQLSVAIR